MENSLHVVRASAQGAHYDITVRSGLLSDAGAVVRGLSPTARKAAVVTDNSVGPLYLPQVEHSLRNAGIDPIRVTLPDGENHKTLNAASAIYDQLLGAAIERSTPLLALGGGVVGDTAGFAAATLLRGLPFIQIPTTLLAMVDASVGGKTGVNHPIGKNLIGAFHQPLAVLIDPATLRTLPLRELRSGLAECIKHDIIRDAGGFSRLEHNIDRALALDLEYLSELIAHNVAIKALVVEKDPLEKAERAHLNFGHTFGHAIETVSRYEYAHGECVALGIVAACRAAVMLRIFDQPSCDRIIALIARAKLPVSGMRLDVDQVVQAMIYDKKVKGGKVRFILPVRLGEVVVRDDVAAEVVFKAVASLTS